MHILVAGVFTRVNPRSASNFASEVLLLATLLLAWSLLGHTFNSLQVDLFQILGLALGAIPRVSGDLREALKRSNFKTALVNKLLDVLFIKFFKFIFKLDELAIVRVSWCTLPSRVVTVATRANLVFTASSLTRLPLDCLCLAHLLGARTRRQVLV